ncbi:MAG: LysR family transcriptional regulator [Paracoccaceae bacterium]
MSSSDRFVRKTGSSPDLNLFRAVEVFMAVAEMQQVTTAAHALGMTQSAASQHLKNLETAFGVKFIDRSQRPIALTHAGACCNGTASGS